MKSYELLAHTADVRILARGSTQAELFEAALQGLCAVLLPGYKEKQIDIGFELTTTSIDMTSLLIDFLSDALTLMHSKQCLLYKAEIISADETLVKSKLMGYRIKEFENDVKAVTYHEAEVKSRDGLMESIIVLDI
jgi:SHS2 domain-containing protein